MAKQLPPRSQGRLEVRAERSEVTRRVLMPAQAFIYTEGVSGFLMFGAAALAMILANSPVSWEFAHLWETTVSVGVGKYGLSKTIHHWINDGLMALFFFVVGLEIKRELVHGELSSLRGAVLPIAAALGGMVVPALAFVALNAGSPTLDGWAVPMATDIAFALAALALLGDRIPAAARIFLLTMATIDDIGAIAVIALFYSHDISLLALGVAVLVLLLMAGMHWLRIQTVTPYIIAGLIVWLAVLKSGIHATIAGVLLGMLAPAHPAVSRDRLTDAAEQLLREEEEADKAGDVERADAHLGALEELIRESEAPLERVERELHPWVGYLVLPIFALANAGVALRGELLGTALSSPLALGIALGLVLGKPVGVLLVTWAAVRLGWARLPEGLNWKHVTGVGMLAGIGFTVSLFITNLAFTDARQIEIAKIAVLAASIIAGVAGYVYLRWTIPAGEGQPPPSPAG